MLATLKNKVTGEIYELSVDDCFLTVGHTPLSVEWSVAVPAAAAVKGWRRADIKVICTENK